MEELKHAISESPLETPPTPSKVWLEVTALWPEDDREKFLSRLLEQLPELFAGKPGLTLNMNQTDKVLDALLLGMSGSRRKQVQRLRHRPLLHRQDLAAALGQGAAGVIDMALLGQLLKDEEHPGLHPQGRVARDPDVPGDPVRRGKADPAVSAGDHRDADTGAAAAGNLQPRTAGSVAIRPPPSRRGRHGPRSPCSTGSPAG